LCTLLLSFCSGSSLLAQSFTIEQVMSSPFPASLTAAKQVPRIAWVFNNKGERNVWIADAPEFRPHQLTHYEGDNGQPIASLQITSDGSKVVYVRGTELNDAGKSANPTASPVAPEQQAWVADTSDGEPHLLGEVGCPDEECEDLHISPDNQWVVWPAKHVLWIAPIDGSSKAVALTDLQGTALEPAWSADSRHIAFTLDREDHSFIVIADVEHGAVTAYHYLSPSVDRDEYPHWSRDNRHIVFLRRHGRESGLPLLQVLPEPWSLWVADTQHYTPSQIWQSGQSSRDSLPSFADRSLKVSSDNHVIFDSEQDGWNHLYSIGLDGGKTTLLTPGEFSVEDVELSADGRSVIFSSNQNDIDRRHIWQVPAAGGEAPVALSQGQSIEWSPLQLSNETTICLGSSATTPALVYKLERSGRKLLTPNALPADFPSSQLVVPEEVVFKSEDGLTVHGQLFRPKNQKLPGPGLIFVHGGPHRQMLLGFNPMGYYHNAYAENQYLASRGFTVLSVNYRLGIMYGHDFEYAPHTYWRGASEYKDVLAGAVYLRSLPTVDAHRIGIWGGSYGGFLTAMALARNSDIFAAGVDYHGMGSLMSHVHSQSALFAPDLQEAQKIAWASSPEAYIDQWKSPVLLIQGDDDRNVDFHQTVDLAQKLRSHDVSFNQIVYPNEIHGFLLWHHWIESYTATTDFFEKHLNGVH